MGEEAAKLIGTSLAIGLGVIGQGIGIGIQNILPQTLDVCIIGIYNPGNVFIGHWIIFAIVSAIFSYIWESVLVT